MAKLLEFLGSLKDRFSVDETAVGLIQQQIDRTNEWIAENTSEEPEKSPRKLGAIETAPESDSVRSIFDDIDAA